MGPGSAAGGMLIETEIQSQFCARVNLPPARVKGVPRELGARRWVAGLCPVVATIRGKLEGMVATRSMGAASLVIEVESDPGIV